MANALIIAWTCDANGNCSYIDPVWIEFTGQTRAEASGGGWMDAVHPDDRHNMLRKFRAARRKDAAFRIDFRIRNRDGQYRKMMAISAPRFERNGAFVGYIGSMIDVEQQTAYLEALERSEAALKASEERLRRADRLKDEFIATLAHELRNPLAPICSGIEVLRRVPSSSTNLEMLDIMARQAKQLVHLVDELMNICLISRGKIELNIEQISLRGYLASAIEAAEPNIRARRHRLTFDASEEVLLQADPSRIIQVFTNLLNNAAKFTEDEGAINLVLEKADGDAIVRLRDTGQGIAPDMLTTIFEPFTQGQPRPARDSGLGVGLALAKALVALHGGSIEAKSEGVGKGSEFIVRLPLAPPVSPQ